MNPFPRAQAAAFAAALGLGLAWAAPARAVNDAEAQMYERAAAFARERASELSQKLEGAGVEMTPLIHKAMANLRALADTKAEIAKRIRAGASEEELAELRRADDDHTRKAIHLRTQLKGSGMTPPDGAPGGGGPRRMEMRDPGASAPGESGKGGFRPRERADRKPGVVALGTPEDLRNWLNEEEARAGAK
jgi:hypothetical protein